MSSGEYTKWIGGVAGFMYGGFLGALIGYHLGKRIGRNFGPKQKMFEMSFEMSLLVLATLVIRADGKIKKEELDCVRLFFVKSFGQAKSDIYFKVFNEIKQKPFPSLRSICVEINQNVNHKSRLQILHFLFGIAQADGNVSPSELNQLTKIAGYLRLSMSDFESIKAMFAVSRADASYAYKILEIEKAASEAEIKKAYRKMVKKYHPDKLQHMDEAYRAGAEEKFRNVQDAYETIQKERGM